MDGAVEPCDRPGRSQEQWIGEGGLSESPLVGDMEHYDKAECRRVKCMCVAALVRPGVTRRNLGWDRVRNISHNKDQVARSPQSSNAPSPF